MRIASIWMGAARVSFHNGSKASSHQQRYSRHNKLIHMPQQVFVRIKLARNFSVSTARAEINKIYPSAAEALKDMESGTTLLCGGFGLCGVPDTLIDEVARKDVKD